MKKKAKDKSFFSYLYSIYSRIPKIWIVLVFLLSITFFVLYQIHTEVIYTFGFTDEGDNISIGSYILQNKKLYTDIFSQHQPLTYYISAGLQSLTDSDNILLAVRRHRQAVILFSFLWISFLTFRFGLRLLPFLVILELMKYYFLGHLFLAESLVIYPCVYLISLVWKIRLGEKIMLLESILISLCMFFIVFNLLPTAAALMVIMIVFILSSYKNKKVWIGLVIPGALATILLFTVTPIVDYFDSAIIANIKYYIPNDTAIAFKLEESKHQGLVSMFFQPFIYFFQNNLSAFSILQILLSFIWLSVVLIYATSGWKKLLTMVLLYVVLVLINSRPAIGSGIFFHTFHSLPYYAMFIASLGWLYIQVFKDIKNIHLKLVLVLPLIIFFSLFMFNKNVYVNESISEEQSSYINFSVIYTYNDIIKTLAEPGDTLAVIPYEELLYWKSGTEPHTRFLFYEAWPMQVPHYNKEIMSALHNDPPTFIYWPVGNLKQYVDESLYVSVPKHDATISALFIKKDKANKISDEKWNSIDRHLFKKPILTESNLMYDDQIKDDTIKLTL